MDTSYDSSSQKYLLSTSTIKTPAPLAPWRRYVGLTICLVECLLFGGTIFGWYSLVYVFKQDGIYSDLCTPLSGNLSTLSNPTPTSVVAPKPECDAQTEQMSLAFTIALAVQGLVALPLGMIFDRYGLLLTRIIASGAGIAGYLLLAFADINRPWMIFPGSALVATSCAAIILTNAHVSSLAGNLTTLAITLYNGACNSSGAVFFIIKLLNAEGIPRVYSMSFLCCLWSIVLISTTLILPYYKVPSSGEPQSPIDNNTDLLPGQISKHRPLGYGSTSSSSSESISGSQHKYNHIDYESVTHKKETPLTRYIFSSLYLTFLLWFATLHVCIMFFLGSFNARISDIVKGDTAKVSCFTNLLAYAQMCAILIAPLSGALMVWGKRSILKKGLTGEGRSIATILSLLLTCTASIVLVVTCLIHTEVILNVSIFVSEVFRSSLYPTAIAFLQITWPGNAFGVLFGLTYLVAGAAAMMQFPYTIWIGQIGFLNVDLILLGTCLTALLLPVTIVIRYHKYIL